MALSLLALLIVRAEVPTRVGVPAVLLDEPVLLRRRGLVLAPIVPTVQNSVPGLDQLLRVVVGGSVEPD
jgi:hypothetical protein